mmetsp:Transcript_40113/g.99135  ORF Transcript_40113/g.99135 Transcript_40113/m.99135 type:complete len:241 (+) Transcript_40113:81-803(+)
MRLLRRGQAGELTSSSPLGGNSPEVGVDEEKDSTFVVEAAEVVNCAGLSAVRLGQALGPRPHRSNLTLTETSACAAHTATFAKGSYFALAGGVHAPFSRLVYPLPSQDLAGLGVHATLDLGGRIRFGPDAEWLGERGVPLVHPDDDPHAFDVDARRAESFYAAIRTYWPGLPDGCLVPDYAGIRPKLSRPGEAAADFEFLRETGGRRVWHLLGIESPGLTSCLALAEEVADAVVAASDAS